MIKHVQKANMWVVTIKTVNDKGRERFERTWFSTREKAEEFQKQQESN